MWQVWHLEPEFATEVCAPIEIYVAANCPKVILHLVLFCFKDISEEIGERAVDLSDAEEEIPEDIPADGDADLTPDVEYADDFEEYASDEVNF